MTHHSSTPINLGSTSKTSYVLVGPYIMFARINHLYVKEVLHIFVTLDIYHI